MGNNFKINNTNLTSTLGEQQQSSGSCKLTGTFGLLIQALLGISIVCVALFKRYVEKPRRDVIVWFLDIFKQMASCGAQHLLNVAFSIVLNEAYSNDHSSPCSWYFVTVIFDCSFLTVFVIMLLVIQQKIISHFKWWRLRTGNQIQASLKNVNLSRGARQHIPSCLNHQQEDQLDHIVCAVQEDSKEEAKAKLKVNENQQADILSWIQKYDVINGMNKLDEFPIVSHQYSVNILSSSDNTFQFDSPLLENKIKRGNSIQDSPSKLLKTKSGEIPVNVTNSLDEIISQRYPSLLREEQVICQHRNQEILDANSDSKLGLLRNEALGRSDLCFFKWSVVRNSSQRIDQDAQCMQLAVWLLTCVFAKSCFFVVQFYCGEGMLSAANYILSPVRNQPQIELLVVMVLTPMALNGLQMWVQDNFLKDDHNLNPKRLQQLLEINSHLSSDSPAKDTVEMTSGIEDSKPKIMHKLSQNMSKFEDKQPVLDGVEFFTIQQFVAHPTQLQIKETTPNGNEALEALMIQINANQPDMFKFIFYNQDNYVLLLNNPNCQSSWETFLMPQCQ